PIPRVPPVTTATRPLRSKSPRTPSASTAAILSARSWRRRRRAAPARPAPRRRLWHYVAPVTLRWTALDRLTPEQRARVVGPGAPFELVEEDVLGTKLEVFARRPRDLRQVLAGGAERYGDLPY